MQSLLGHWKCGGHVQWLGNALALGLVALALQACVTATDREKTIDRLTRFANEVYFGSPYDSLHAQSKKLLRWHGPMTVLVKGERVSELLPRIRARLEPLAAHSGIAIEAVTDEDANANVTLVLEKDASFAINDEYAQCYVRLRQNETHIIGGQIHIGAHEEENFAHCLDHEFLHLLGMRFHSAAVRSALSPAHRNSGLTEWDALALRLLFDERLRPGQSEESATPIIRGFMTEEVRNAV